MNGFGQSDTCKIQLIKAVKNDSVQLRWAINSPSAWAQIKMNGFWVERASISADSTASNAQFIRLTSNPSKPLNPLEWKVRFRDQSKAAAMAQTLLFSETNSSNTQINPELITQKDQEQSMRLGFSLLVADQDFEVAKAMGLGYSDRLSEKNQQYLYRVYSAEKIEGFVVDTAYIYVETNQIDPIPQMRVPAVEIGDQKITLKWRSNQKSGFTAYHIERSSSLNENFERLNDAPVIKLNTTDSNSEWVFYSDSVSNYQTFSYRIIGITPFGELSQPSAAIAVMARDLTPPSPAVILKTVEVEKQQMKIEWMLPETSSDLKNLKVGRSDANDGEYKFISSELSKTSISFIDKEPIGFRGAYYKVFAFDTAGNYSQSLPFYGMLTDSFPPAIPADLNGYIDTNSVVHLNWKRGIEPDLMGYRVYFANSPDHEFSVLTSYVSPDTTYNDSIQKRTLTKHIYYSIAAVDFNYNHSEKSPWVKIRRLDVIPPDAPIFKDVEVKDSSVVLKWFNSSSDDVARHKLLRRTSGTKEFLPLAEWEGYPDSTQFIDRNVAPKTFYDYAMVAIDSSNLVSENSPLISVRTFDRGLRPEVNNFTVKYDPEKKLNIIEWNYDQKGDFSFLVYRSYQNFGLSKYVKIEGAKNSYSDSDLIGNGLYTYAIKAVYQDGGESPVSQTQSVTVE